MLAFSKKNKDKYSKLVKNNGYAFNDIELDLSFRSLPAILDITDKIFSEIFSHEKHSYIEHKPHRKKRGSLWTCGDKPNYKKARKGEYYKKKHYGV